MAKILLVQAIKINRVNPIITPPLGLMYLASALKKHSSQHIIKIVDLRLESNIEKEIIESSPDIVGLSTMTQDAHFMHSIAKRIREARREVSIVAGGPHATAYSEEVLRDANIDYLVIGEGEQAVCELIDRIENRESCAGIKGIAFRMNGNTILNTHCEYISDLDIICFPDWEMIDINRYTHNPNCNDLRISKEKFMPIFTSRGCPYQCIYCHNLFDKKYRTRSPENVLLEIETLYYKYGVKEIEIWDDLFNLDLDRAKRIADLIRESRMDIKLSFPNGLRADRIDEELLIKLKQAGTYHIAFAIETASRRLQRVIKKNLNLERASQAVSLACKLGIFTRGFFMLGFPTETKAEMLDTINFARESKLNMASFFIPNPFKGTELFEMAKKLGKNIDFDYSNYDYNIGSCNLSHLSCSELAKFQRRAYLSFYFQAKRFWQLVLRLPDKKQLFKYILQFWKRIK